MCKDDTPQTDPRCRGSGEPVTARRAGPACHATPLREPDIVARFVLHARQDIFFRWGEINYERAPRLHAVPTAGEAEVFQRSNRIVTFGQVRLDFQKEGVPRTCGLVAERKNIAALFRIRPIDQWPLR